MLPSCGEKLYTLYHLSFAKTHWEGNGIPLQYSCLENPMNEGAWWAAVHMAAKSRTRLRTSLSLLTFMHWRRRWQPTLVVLPGESQGWGSLGAAVYGVAQSRTRLKRLSSSSNSKTHWTCNYSLFKNNNKFQLFFKL